VEIALHEALTGAVTPPERPLRAAPLALDLTLHGRGLIEVALGAPLDVEGTFRGSPGADDLASIPDSGAVWGTARLLLPRGIFYDLRLGAGRAAGQGAVLVLAGARRFVRGDLYASATTFDGSMSRGASPLGAVRLRFDARDDLGSLLRSLRLGGSASARARQPAP
jgi:hypothetical protein